MLANTAGPHHQDNLTTVFHGDALDVLPLLDADSCGAIICDPPYAVAITKNERGPRWDGSEIAFSGDLWRAARRVVAPGATVAAFGHPRTMHRMMTAMEDAGLQIIDVIAVMDGQGYAPGGVDLGRELSRLGADAAPAYEGWSSALRPGLQPLVIARKIAPRESLAKVIAGGGVGGFNVGAVRSPTTENRSRRPGQLNEGRPWRVQRSGLEMSAPTPGGRTPNNVALVHGTHCEAVGCRADCVVAQVNAQGRAARGRGEETSRLYPVIHHPKAPPRERPTVNGVSGPSVKAIGLMEYLVKLLVPTGGTVLDIFAGTGSTLVAAAGLGVRSIGIEKEAAMVELIGHRLRGAAPQMAAR